MYHTAPLPSFARSCCRRQSTITAAGRKTKAAVPPSPGAKPPRKSRKKTSTVEQITSASVEDSISKKRRLPVTTEEQGPDLSIDEIAYVDLGGNDYQPTAWSERLNKIVTPQQPEQTEIEEEETEEPGTDRGQLSAPRHIIVEPSFLKQAEALRDVFDGRFEDPRHTQTERFLWDYWHVPDQYTLIRTQAQVYFPPPLYAALEDALLEYGEQKLGCRAITPIWLSYYVDGCCQELHCDNPHGPFAFVFSLTNWEERQFQADVGGGLGGETMILKPQVLGNYWQDFSSERGQELRDLLTLVEPHFNQLLVFDPRFPHGVRPVRGTRDPMHSRLVLHGWFAEPSPFFEGALSEQQAVPTLSAATEELYDILAELPPAAGLLTVRLTVRGKDGRVQGIEWLADTLVPRGGADEGVDVRAAIHHAVHDCLTKAKFPKARGGGITRITLPLLFE